MGRRACFLECNQIEKIKKESLLLGGEKLLLLCNMSSSLPQQWSRLHWHGRHITALVGEEINLGLVIVSISVYGVGSLRTGSNYHLFLKNIFYTGKVKDNGC